MFVKFNVRLPLHCASTRDLDFNPKSHFKAHTKQSTHTQSNTKHTQRKNFSFDFVSTPAELIYLFFYWAQVQPFFVHCTRNSSSVILICIHLPSEINFERQRTVKNNVHSTHIHIYQHKMKKGNKKKNSNQTINWIICSFSNTFHTVEVLNGPSDGRSTNSTTASYSFKISFSSQDYVNRSTTTSPHI